MKDGTCGTCRWNRYDSKRESFYCRCEQSDYLWDETFYDDSCECWETNVGKDNWYNECRYSD
jgi:hypothetical protein